MPKTMKKKPATATKTAKTRAPKAAKTAKAKKPSNVISFTELFELKKKRMEEAQRQQQQRGWKDGTTGQTHEGPGDKFQVNTRAGRTGGMGSRHH